LILAKFLHWHNKQRDWWFKDKLKLKVDANAALPSDEAPGEYCLSKLLGLSMNELWEALIACNLANKMGKRGNFISLSLLLSLALDYSN
jgi:hypothetical protein